MKKTKCCSQSAITVHTRKAFFYFFSFYEQHNFFLLLQSKYCSQFISTICMHRNIKFCSIFSFFSKLRFEHIFESCISQNDKEPILPCSMANVYILRNISSFLSMLMIQHFRSYVTIYSHFDFLDKQTSETKIKSIWLLFQSRQDIQKVKDIFMTAIWSNFNFFR